jgi:hypothetical protein
MQGGHCGGVEVRGIVGLPMVELPLALEMDGPAVRDAAAARVRRRGVLPAVERNGNRNGNPEHALTWPRLRSCVHCSRCVLPLLCACEDCGIKPFD